MTISIDPRFEGPPGSANGGYFAGAAAPLLDGSVAVTIRKPPPLGLPMRTECEGAFAAVWDGDDLVAEIHSHSVDVKVPDPVSFPDAEVASKGYLGFEEHPYPRCFVCGPARAEGDGLRIFPGQVPERKLLAAPWIPGEDMTTPDGAIDPKYVWAALDCPGNWAPILEETPPEGPWLLGRLSVRQHGPALPGERLVVTGWSLGREGRRLLTASALFSEDGDLRAVSAQTCVVLRPERTTGLQPS